MDVDLNEDLGGALTWIILGAVGGFVLLVGGVVVACFIWRRYYDELIDILQELPCCPSIGPQPGRRDSLEDLEGEVSMTTRSQALRQWRRSKAAVVGVKNDPSPIRDSASSGFKWKKKWRDRKVKSKEKRKIKHQQRKVRRAERKAAEERQRKLEDVSKEHESDAEESEDESEDSEDD